MGIRELLIPWTQQPQELAGPGSEPWAFLWSAAYPTVNLACMGSVPDAPIIGTAQVGPGGIWRDFIGATSQSWDVPLPTNLTGYTFVAVYPYSAASQPGFSLIRTTGGGFRFEPSSTGGGAYVAATHTAVAGLSVPAPVSAVFDARPWLFVGTYDGVTARTYWRTSDGEIYTASDASVGMADGTGTLTVSTIGGSLGAYALAYMPAPITDNVALRLLTNQWSLFEPLRLFRGTTGSTEPDTTQHIPPNADVAAGAWAPSTGSDLWAMLDEATASDVDYIGTTTASTAEIALGDGLDPLSSAGHVVRFRAKGVGTLLVSLYQGTTLIASYTPTLTGAFQTFSFTLSGAEADSITNYGDLRLKFASS